MVCGLYCVCRLQNHFLIPDCIFLFLAKCVFLTKTTENLGKIIGCFVKLCYIWTKTQFMIRPPAHPRQFIFWTFIYFKHGGRRKTSNFNPAMAK